MSKSTALKSQKLVLIVTLRCHQLQMPDRDTLPISSQSCQSLQILCHSLRMLCQSWKMLCQSWIMLCQSWKLICHQRQLFWSAKTTKSSKKKTVFFLQIQWLRSTHTTIERAFWNGLKIKSISTSHVTFNPVANTANAACVATRAVMAHRTVTFVMMTIKRIASRRCVKLVVTIWCAIMVLRWLRLHSAFVAEPPETTRNVLFIPRNNDSEQSNGVSSFS